MSLLNEGEQDCHHTEESTAQPLGSWWITAQSACVRACARAWTETRIYVGANNLCVHAHAHKKTSLCMITVYSNSLRSYSTGSWVHDQPSQQVCVLPVIQVFEFAQVFRLPCGIVVFAPFLFQCVSVERYTVLWISASVWIPWSSLLFPSHSRYIHASSFLSLPLCGADWQASASLRRVINLLIGVGGSVAVEASPTLSVANLSLSPGSQGTLVAKVQSLQSLVCVPPSPSHSMLLCFVHPFFTAIHHTKEWG